MRWFRPSLGSARFIIRIQADSGFFCERDPNYISSWSRNLAESSQIQLISGSSNALIAFLFLKYKIQIEGPESRVFAIKKSELRLQGTNLINSETDRATPIGKKLWFFFLRWLTHVPHQPRPTTINSKIGNSGFRIFPKSRMPKNSLDY